MGGVETTAQAPGTDTGDVDATMVVSNRKKSQGAVFPRSVFTIESVTKSARTKPFCFSSFVVPGPRFDTVT